MKTIDYLTEEKIQIFAKIIENDLTLVPGGYDEASEFLSQLIHSLEEKDNEKAKYYLAQNLVTIQIIKANQADYKERRQKLRLAKQRIKELQEGLKMNTLDSINS